MELVIVLPCYNEEEVLPSTLETLSGLLMDLRQKHKIDKGFIFLVDDGSSDKTWAIIEQSIQDNENIWGLKLAHNVGHQNALWAGMEQAVEKLSPDAVVTIDADLQDDARVMESMVDDFMVGSDIVYGVRENRATDSFFKRHTAQLFYKLMKFLGAEVVYNHADYRLMSYRSIKALATYPERNLFLRGMVKTLGFRSTCVYYRRLERKAGESKYPLHRMFSFAVDGITSFSVRPLRMIALLGMIFMLIAICAILYAIYSFVTHHALPGWTSLLVSVWFIGGAILVSLGMIGEYVGKIYKEVKRRPRYIIDKLINHSSNA